MQIKSYPKYKESGIEWIGEIPEEWEVHRIKSFVPYIKNGQWGDDSSGGNNDFIVLRVADFLEFNFNLNKELTIRNIKDTNLKLKEGDLVIEKSGGGEKQLVGRVVQLKNSSKEKKYTYSNFIGKLEISHRMNKTFLNYYFKDFYNNRVNINYIKQTTGIQNLDSASLIQREYFAYPTDKNYQKSIVSFLDKKIAELDELIEKDKTLIEFLKEKRTALINHAVTKGLDPNVKMKDSGIDWIGKIPETAKIIPFRRICYLNQGLQFPQAERLVEPNEYSKIYITIKYLHSDEKVEEYIPNPPKSVVCEKQDVLLARTGATGEVITNQKGVFHNNFFRINYDKNIYRDYLVYYLKMESIKEYLLLKAGVTTIPDLNHDAFLDSPFIIYPIEEQEKIAKYLVSKSNKIDKTIQKIEQKINLLEKYKKSLIHHVVTGKVDVREV